MPKLRPANCVLVIDEEPFCRLMARILADLGYKVITSNEVSSTYIDGMTESDILFVDVMMPRISSLQVLDILASHEIKSPIVLMSGADAATLATAETKAKQLDLELIGVLAKPFRVHDVRAILEVD